MNRKDTLYIRKITEEYIKFVKTTNAVFEETSRATALAIKKVLDLKDGDNVLIKEDGSIEVEDAK